MNRCNNPFQGRVDMLPEDEFLLLERAVAARRCREETGFSSFDEAAAAHRTNLSCPGCGSGDTRKDGFTPAGRQRFRCRRCGAGLTVLTGTIFENSKKDLATWVEFVRLMTYNVPLDASAEICRITHQTAFEWRHRVFATVDGYQERIVLRDRIWIDETYISDTDLTRGFGQARRRGLSKQKICIAVAIDVHKNCVAVVAGHGKPSSKRIKDVLSAYVAEGSVVVHDMEKAHNALIRERKCRSEAYKADVRDPEYLECMAMANSLCSWLKRYLWRFMGMDPKNLQSYLNWFAYLFRVNQARDKWPKTERVVRHLMMTDARYRTKTPGNGETGFEN